MPDDRAPQLRPWWHVGVPFWIGAIMVGAIGIAGRNPLALLLMVVFGGWGLWWSLGARRGAQAHASAIASATALLTDPSAEHAVWLGPATLLLRPRRPGHLLWIPGGVAFTSTDAGALADTTRRVMTGACDVELTLPFDELTSWSLETKMLSGLQLVFRCTDGEIRRFRISDPVTYSFLLRAVESRS